MKLESHGREVGDSGQDLSETLGWFTALYPLKLHLANVGMESQEALAGSIKSVKEQLRSVPNKGLGFGVLRYLAQRQDLAERDCPHPAQIVFNYLGQFDQYTEQKAVFQGVDADSGSDIADDITRDHFIGVGAIISDRCLRIRIDYLPAIHDSASMESFRLCYEKALKTLIAHCRDTVGVQHTPSDFPLAGDLSLNQLEAWEAKYPHIEHVYPVTGMQMGFIYHSLLDTSKEAYASQLYIDFEGDFDRDSFCQAWDAVVARHGIFRTAFEGFELAQPMQIVTGDCDMDWRIEDWREKDSDRQAADFEQLRRQEKSIGFAFDRAPLMRQTLIRLTDRCHRWLWTHHHSILDGWSVPIVLNDLFTCYQILLGDRPISRTPPPEYVDYVGWLHKQNSEAAINYWTQELAGIELPTPTGLRFRKHTQVTPEMTEQRLELDAEQTVRLRQCAADRGVTVNTLFHTAWSILLSRYSGRQEIVFGQTVSGRPPEIHNIESMVGLFINTLPVRVTCTRDEDLGRFIHTINAAHAVRESYGYLPLVDIKNACGMSRADSLFDTLLVVQNYPSQDALKSLGDDLGFTISRVGSDVATNFGLTLVISPGAKIGVTIEFDRHAFILAEVAQLLARFKYVLMSLCDLRPRRVGEVFIEAPENKPHSTNEALLAFPSVWGVHQLFERQVKQTPEAAAVIYQGETYSYRVLNAYAERLARTLICSGLQVENRVALYMDNSLCSLVSIFAVLKAGGAYVPIDPVFPIARVEFILRDSKATHLLVQNRLHSQCECFASVHTLIVDDVTGEAYAQVAEDNQARPVSAQSDDQHRGQLAYVIYTSGSTGQPKGVMVSHHNVLHYLHHGSAYLAGGVSGSVLSSALVFDATVSAIFIPLIHGKSVEILPQDDTLIEHLADCIGDDSDSLLFKLTPSHLRAVINADLIQKNRGASHVFIVGGEQFSRSLQEELGELLPASSFVNEYGPTEATVGCSVFRSVPAQGGLKCLGDMAKVLDDVPIGKAIDGTQLYCVDDELKPQPHGIVGQLAIAGEGVTRGYLNNGALTAKKFVPNPWSAQPDARMYLSGDRVCRLPDGNFLYLGRNDEQIKIRGRRVEPGEIEACLTALPDVASGIVLLSQREGDNAKLVAFVTLATQNSDVDNVKKGQEIKTLLSVHLPDYMMPFNVCVFPSLPLTVNGKIDRKALLDMDVSSPAGGIHRAPTNAIEHRLCALWRTVLDLEEVGIKDNFFELGGHSILATRLISLVREEFSVELKLQALFDAPTVASLASELEHLKTAFVLPPISPMPRDTYIPLSYAQQRLWFIDQLGQGSAHYNMVNAVVLQGEFDQSALKCAIADLLHRHEALRTHFSYINDRPFQVVKQEYDIPLVCHDLRQQTSVKQAEYVQNVFQQESTRLFVLDRDLLLRVHALSISDSVQLALYATHHIAGDGWSMNILQRDLKTYYDAHVNGREVPVVKNAIQYADYAHWQRDWLRGDVLQQQLHYWRQQLHGIPHIHNLPLDFKRPVQQSFRGKVHIQNFAPNLSMQLIALSKHFGVTLFSLLETAFALLLGRYSGEEQIVVGAAVAGRNHKALEDTVGFFINSVVLRTDLSQDPTFAELLARNHQVILDAHAHQHVPFEMLVEDLQPERSLSYNPLFQMMFAVETLSKNDLEVLSLDADIETLLRELQQSQSRSSTTRSDLQVQVVNANGDMSVSWVYNESLFTAKTLATLSESYEVLLGAIVSDYRNEAQHSEPSAIEGGRPISQLDILSQSQYEHLLALGTGPAAQSLDVFLHQVFEQQAKKTPGNIAVIADGESIDYQPLNSRANQLARLLIKMGVQPFSIVGLCCEHSIGLMVGMLGILKAGAAYLALDPNLPASRQNYMLDDCRVSSVLAGADIYSDFDFGDRKVIPLDENMLTMLAGAMPTSNLDDDNVSVLKQHAYEAPAYVIYTSGSTGKPKGVEVSHRAAGNYLGGASRSYYRAQLTGSVAVTSYCVDMTLPSLYLPLFHGHCVNFISGGFVVDSLRQHLLTSDTPLLIRMTPSHVLALLDLMPPDSVLMTQHVFVIGGETLHLSTLSILQSRFPKAEIINHYGPTEAVVGCVLNPTSDSVSEFTTGGVSIGRPMEGVRLCILDGNQQLQIPGSVGELVVGGCGVATAYVNAPHATAERFIAPWFLAVQKGSHVASPVEGLGGERFYRTGDLVRWLPNGELSYIGRRDDQIKIRGYRVEIGEIESAVNAVSEVKDVAVVIRAPERYETMLIAYIVPQQEIQGEEDWEINHHKAECIKGIKKRLAASLPAHMIPQVFVFIDHLPLSDNGKLQKQHLPEPEESDLNHEAYVAPSSDLETQLCQLWASMFKLDRVGIHDNFFTLGGHSLLATRFISTLRDEYSVELPVKLVFEFPTIAELAMVISAQQLNNAEASEDEEEIIL